MSLRLIHLSDIHFGGEDRAAVDAATAYTHDARPDAVVVTGDLTLNGLPDEFRAAAAWLQRLPTPRLITPGNHDTPYWNLLLRALTPFARYRRYVGPPDGEALQGDGFAVRMLNTSRGAQPRPDWSKGAVDLVEAQNLVKAFEHAGPHALRVIGCHHPLVEAPGSPVIGGVRRGAAAAKLFTEGAVDVILTGHVHNPFAIALPFADERTYAIGAGTLSVRTRGVPPSFNVVTIEPACLKVEAIAWAEGRLDTLQAWTLPRRAQA